MPDPFESFAEEHGLQLTAEPLPAAPRNILTPLEAAEQHFLVELTRTGTSAAPVRLIFVTPLTEPTEPRLRDVLWWLASDAWVLEQGERKLELWAAAYGYPPGEEATARLFALHVRQAEALASLLGEVNYRHLLTLIAQEVDQQQDTR